jgi:triphosphoribosyl-dephospho-CoA synthase
MSQRALLPSRQQHFLAACELDVTSLKPGNVRVGAPAHGMDADDFVRSAQASAAALDQSGASVGRRVLAAIERTHQLVRRNTNLGIVLLAAPLFSAAEEDPTQLRACLQRRLNALDRCDAVLVYRAIRLVNPGGIGTSARHDVQSEPQVTLLQAMREAQDRDSIARQYAQGFGDVFDLGLAQWDQAMRRLGEEARAATHVYLAYLSRWRDSLIERKFGAATAQAVSNSARECFSRLLSSGRFEDVEPSLLAWDQELRRAGLNPGTSADLTVATVFAAKLTRAV